jgi:hypothetical protein
VHPIAKNPEVDPTLPKVELKLGRKTYYLCFTYGALTQAEAELRKLGVKTNMLKALDFETLDATTLSALLYAAILTHDPSITPESAAALIVFKNIGKIREALLYAFVASLADPVDEEASEDAPLVPATA